MLQLLTKDLKAGLHLTQAQCADAVTELVNEAVAPEAKADFLCELALKGETVDEIAGFAAALRERSIQPPLDAATRAHEILDVCGTGGDRLNTFNISTTVAIVCAAAGVAVAKHGNRAITSKSGSADVLEALGVRVDFSPTEAAASLAKHKFAFFFAPNFHPAFKFIGPARKLCADRGQRTIFNFLGPLLNPARPTAQLVGVPRPQLCEPLAQVLQRLGIRRGMVVSGKVTLPDSKAEAFLDELSVVGESTIAEFYHERGFTVSAMQASAFPVQPATLADLAGGDREANAAIIRELLAGRERGPKRDAVLLNSAAALFVASRCRSLSEGWELAGQVIDSGAAAKKLQELAA